MATLPGMPQNEDELPEPDTLPIEPDDGSGSPMIPPDPDALEPEAPRP